MNSRNRSRSSRPWLVAGLLALLGAAAPAAATPGNDNFADAIDATAFPFAHSTDTTGATTEAGEPVPSCGAAAATVWYRMTSAIGRRVELRTFGSKFDTILAVYTGSGLTGLTEAGCNDDATDVGSQQSRLGLSVDAGTDYFVQVGGYLGASGVMKLTIEPSLNDDFAEAIFTTIVPFTHEVDTAAATTEPDEPEVCAPQAATVWYRLQTAQDTDVKIDTFGSDFDTVLTAHTGSALENLTPIACNDQAESNFSDQSEIFLSAEAGETYHLQVGGYFGSTGHLVLNITLPSAPGGPPNNTFANAVLIEELPYTDELDTAGASMEPGEPDPSCAPAGATVWYKINVQQGQLLVVDTLGSDYDTVVAVYEGESLETLEEVICNDDLVLGTVTHSTVPLVATGDLTYYIQVGGWEGATGQLTLNVAQPL